MTELKKLISITACIIVSLNLSAQDTEPSPWSRFGMGLPTHIISTPQLLMGGVSSPIVDGFTINPYQPAAAAGCLNTTFQTSLQSSVTKMQEGDSTATVNNGTPGAISVVVKRLGGKYALSFGMLPNTGMGYNVGRTYEDSLVGTTREQYDGSGGTAKSYLGLARGFKGKKWISAGASDSVLVTSHTLFLGAQVDYLFGEVIQTGRLDIFDVTFFDNRTRTSMRHRSLGALFGIQASQLLWAKYDADKNFEGAATLYFGATYSPSSILYTDYEKAVETVQLLSNVETVIDTAFYSSFEGEGVMPSRWSAGGSIVFDSKSGRKLLLAGDYMQEDWTEFEGDSQIDFLGSKATWAKSTRTSIGLTLSPKTIGNTSSFLTRSTYRAGFALDAYPIEYDGVQLSGWRASAGLSIPLEGSRSSSMVHFGLSAGKRGAGLDNGTVLVNTLEETTLNIQIGVTLTPFFKNLWLTPRLYD